MTYIVRTENNAWSYVVSDDGDQPPKDSGPWRYRWEAQEYADELNSKQEGLENGNADGRK